MASSAVPLVPWTSSVESPQIAAARCSDTHVLAVPGTPSSSSARSVASVATATSMSRRGPTYFGVMTIASLVTPPSRYVTTACGDIRHEGGRGRSSARARAASSSAYTCSACGRSRASSVLEGAGMTLTLAAPPTFEPRAMTTTAAVWRGYCAAAGGTSGVTEAKMASVARLVTGARKMDWARPPDIGLAGRQAEGAGAIGPGTVQVVGAGLAVAAD